MKKVKLGEICEIQAGGTPSRNKQEFWVQGNIPWVKIKDINSKYISKVEEHITDLGLRFSSAKLFSRGTILYTIFATIGEVAILDIDAATNQAIAGLHLKSEKVLKEYLYFFLLSIKNRVRNDSRGVAQNNINLTYLKNIEVPIVENSIQQEICNNLTKINQIITLRNQQLIELSNLVKSRFNEMFGDPVLNEMGWDKHALKEFGIWKSGGTPKRNEEEFFRGNIPWITSGELEHKYIEDSFEKISEKAIECSSAKIIEKGSLLLGMYDTAGLKSSINTKVMSCNQAIAFAKLDDKITNTIYVYYVIQNLRSMLLNQQRGVRQKNFNLSMIKNISIPLPPLSLQNEFANFVAQVDKSQLAIQKSLEELETLKKSLMQEYFG